MKLNADANPDQEELPLPTLERRSSDSVLTPREIEIIILVRRGLRNREIGEVLGISEQEHKEQTPQDLR